MIHSELQAKLRATAHMRLNGRRMPLHAETVLYLIKSYCDERTNSDAHGHPVQ